MPCFHGCGAGVGVRGVASGSRSVPWRKALSLRGFRHRRGARNLPWGLAQAANNGDFRQRSGTGAHDGRAPRTARHRH